MSSKVDNIEVPEASPDSNEYKQSNVGETKAAPPSRKDLWIGLFAIVVVAIVIITVPLVMMKDDNDDKSSTETVTAGSQAATFTGFENAPQCFEPIEGDDCTTEESYNECQGLIDNGCQTVISSFSCPPKHSCGDESAVHLPASDLCPPPVPDNHCITEASHQQCMSLVNSGCTKIKSTRSCPPQHICDDESPEQLPALAACTMELRPCSDGTGVGRSGPNCQFEQCPDGSCPVDTYACPDGSELTRDPSLGCEFAQCPPAIACPMDLHTCPDGRQVGRSGADCIFQCPEGEAPALMACTMELAPCSDGTGVGRTGSNCQFEQCPDGGCPIDTYLCPDGSELTRDPSIGCEYDQCPPAIACPMDLHTCPDGSQVGRSSTDCTFECPEEPVMCTMDVKECADGSFVGRAGPVCDFEPCPEEFVVACTLDLGICTDGTSVGRTAPNCDFEQCPDGSCTIDTFLCPDGSEVARDPENKCEFKACPAPPLMPCTMELHWCQDGTSVGRSGPNCSIAACPDGLCPIGTYLCPDGKELERDPAMFCEFPECN